MIKHLYDEIAKRWYRGGTIWLYSDPHFGDEEMKELRKNYIGDEEQLKRINSKVGKKDTIIFLGDIGDVSYIKRVKGYKVLIMGNHEKGASNYKRNDFYTDMFGNSTDNHLFDEVYEGPLMVNDRLILSHEPFPTSITLFNIHGHSHARELRYDEEHLNICAENIDYTPVNFKALIESGLLKSVISSHRDTINKANKRLEKRFGEIWKQNRLQNEK